MSARTVRPDSPKMILRSGSNADVRPPAGIARTAHAGPSRRLSNPSPIEPGRPGKCREASPILPRSQTDQTFHPSAQVERPTGQNYNSRARASRHRMAPRPTTELKMASRSERERLQGDPVAEAFELPDHALGIGLSVVAEQQVVGAEVGAGRPRSSRSGRGAHASAQTANSPVV